jgi:hypothetical protein
MSGLGARLRAEVDEDVNGPLDRLLDEAAGRVEALEMVPVEMLASVRGLSASGGVAASIVTAC